MAPISIKLNSFVFDRHQLIEGKTDDSSISLHGFSFLNECRGTERLPLDLQSTGTLNLTNSIIKIPSGALNAGFSHCINLAVVNGQQIEGNVTSEITVPRSPSSGVCSIELSEATPIEFQTKVSIVCRSWVTESSNFPLEYSWVLLDSQDNREKVAFTAGSSSFETAYFPAGSYRIGVEVRDQIGLVGWLESSQILSLQVSNAGSDNRLQAISNLASTYAYRKHFLSTLASLSLVAASISPSDTQLAGVLVEVLQVMIGDGFLASLPLAEIVLNVLDHVCKQDMLTSSQLESAVSILSATMSASSLSVLNSRKYYISAEFIQKAYDINDRVIGFLNGVETDLSGKLSEISSSRQEIAQVFLSHQICGEATISHESEIGSYRISIQQDQTDTLRCANTATPLTKTLDPCSLYTCSQTYIKTLTQSISGTNYSSINPYLHEYKFLQADAASHNSSVIVVQEQDDQFLTIDIEVDPAFAIANSILENSSKNLIACINLKADIWSSGNCSLVALDTSKSTCLCRYPDPFFLQMKKDTILWFLL